MNYGNPRRGLIAFACAAVLLVGAPMASAGGTIEVGEHHSVSFGAGMRAGYANSDAGSDYSLQSVRLYVNGQIHEKVKFTFNTECESCVFGQDAGDPVGAAGDIDVLDAIAQFEFSPEFNLWIGRMLTPADRIELNGPYYGLSWNQYTVPLLPSDQLGQAGLLGRDDGVTVWGTLGKLQYSAGLFDGVDGGPNQDGNSLFAARVAFNFLSMEANPAYYTSSTYYGGGGDVFTIGASFQSQNDGTGTSASPANFSAFIIDALLEKPFDNGSAITLEAEHKSFNAPPPTAGSDCFCLFDGSAWFFTAAYLFPGEAGIGRVQPYFRLTSNEPSDAAIGDSELTEYGINYIINGHNLRLNVHVTDGDANLTGAPGADETRFGFGVQVQI